MNKFNIEGEVYFRSGREILCGIVVQITCCRDGDIRYELYDKPKPGELVKPEYRAPDRAIDEDELFASRKDLIDSEIDGLECKIKALKLERDE